MRVQCVFGHVCSVRVRPCVFFEWFLLPRWQYYTHLSVASTKKKTKNITCFPVACLKFWVCVTVVWVSVCAFVWVSPKGDEWVSALWHWWKKRPKMITLHFSKRPAEVLLDTMEKGEEKNTSWGTMFLIWPLRAVWSQHLSPSMWSSLILRWLSEASIVGQCLPVVLSVEMYLPSFPHWCDTKDDWLSFSSASRALSLWYSWAQPIPG